MQDLSISVVVPVYSGGAYLSDLVDQVALVRDNLIESQSVLSLSEVIFVDDASIDDSSKILDDLSEHHSWVSVLHLGRNFGQHAATIAGILHTDGDWVVTMDEDLQHSPKDILSLLERVANTQCDIVYAQPIGAVHESRLRDLSSRLYKMGLECVSSTHHIRKANSFRLIRGGVARGASSVCGHDTYFDIALTWFSNRIESVPLDLKDQRFIQSGKSGYSLKSLLSHSRRMLVSSNLKVLRMGALFGFIATLLSIIAAIGLIITKVVNPESILTQGWASTILAITTFGGLTLMFLGIILEYLSLLIQRAHGRPVFFVLNRSKDIVLKNYFATIKA